MLAVELIAFPGFACCRSHANRPALSALVAVLHFFVMITKRGLGLILILLGSGAIIANLALVLLGLGQGAGLGPAQQWALFLSGIIIALGMTLIPFGDRPA